MIDVLAVCDPSVRDQDLQPLIEGTNFRDLGNLSDGGDQVQLFRKPRSGRLTHQLYMVSPTDPFREQSLQFRDWLRRNPSDAARYGELKRYLAELFPDSSEDYRRGKIGFFRHIRRLHAEAAATF